LRRCSEFTPGDDLLDFLQQRDGAPVSYDCAAAAAASAFEGRVGSLRRRRRSAVTPELMQLDRERAAAAASPAAVTHCPTDMPEPPPRAPRRRLLPQPDRAKLAAAGAVDRDAELRHAAAVSGRYFVPISNRHDQQRESRTPSARRLPLLVDTGVEGTFAANDAVSTATHDRRVFSTDEASAVPENRTNGPACASLAESRRSDTEVLRGATVATPPRRQHHHYQQQQQQPVSPTAANESDYVNDDDDGDKLLDLPQDERCRQTSSRLTFRSSTLPRRWKLHGSHEESPRLLERHDCRELWNTQTGACEENGQGVAIAEPRVSALSNGSSDSTATQSVSALSRVESMKDRLRRLSEMYRDSLDEDSAVMSARTKKSQHGDERPACDADVAEAGSKATSVCSTSTAGTSNTESPSSCERDEGFESETTTNSLVSGADVGCPESRAPRHLAADENSSATSTISSELDAFASCVDSIFQQTSLRSFDRRTSVDEAGDASPSSSRRGAVMDHEAAASTAASSRLSRLREQRAFAERMSAPRRSATRSPQRRTSTPSNGLFSSPAPRRKTSAPASDGASPGVERRRKSDASEVDDVSRFVRGSVARTSLPHTGVTARTAATSTKPTRDQKQPAAAASSSRRSYRSQFKQVCFLLLRTLTTWHYPHLASPCTPRCCAPRSDRYLLPALHRKACCCGQCYM